MKLHPRQCQHCSGASILAILETALNSNSAEQVVTSIANSLMLRAQEYHEYETRKLALSFLQIVYENLPVLSNGDPKLFSEKAGTSPDFSPHPTHRSWAASSCAEALSEGTPSHLCGMESQRSYIQKNASGRGL